MACGVDCAAYRVDAAGDAGGALGAALFTWFQLLQNPRPLHQPDGQGGSFLGPKCETESIRRYLARVNAPHEEIRDEDSLCERVASLLAAGKVVGWVQGRMEFGPRSLGARSILGDARNPEMQSVMNLKIKFRESFRPFAPVVLQDRVHEYFETRPEESSPYMLIVSPVRSGHRKDSGSSGRKGIDRLKEIRSDIPAVTHVDYSARIQTVDPVRHGRFHRLMKSFEAQTGCPVLINTSFNVRGEPIVCGPDEAYRCFLATNIDVLVLETFVLEKEHQPKLSPEQVNDYMKQFKMD